MLGSKVGMVTLLTLSVYVEDNEDQHGQSKKGTLLKKLNKYSQNTKYHFMCNGWHDVTKAKVTGKGTTGANVLRLFYHYF